MLENLFTKKRIFGFFFLGNNLEVFPIKIREHIIPHEPEALVLTTRDYGLKLIYLEFSNHIRASYYCAIM